VMLNRQLCKLCYMLGENRTRQHHHKLRSAFRRGFECASEVVGWDFQLQRLHLEIQ